MADARFMTDHMLVKLGKYLRIAGCDASWDLQIRTHALIERANAEGRIFLTRNTRLAAQYPCPLKLFVLRETDPARQFRIVVAEFRLDPLGRLFSKCIRCNVFLDKIENKELIRARVHPNVYARFDSFFTCPKCKTVFWKGTHVTNTCRKLGLPAPGEYDPSGLRGSGAR